MPGDALLAVVDPHVYALLPAKAGAGSPGFGFGWVRDFEAHEGNLIMREMDRYT